MANFGYLNENNPFTIGDSESQEMYNCRLERGFLEYSDFKIPQDDYVSTLGRKVTLPNGKDVVIDTSRAIDQGYAARGELRLKQGDTLQYFGVQQPDFFSGISLYQPFSDFTEVIGSASTVSGKYTYTITLSRNYKSNFVFRYIALAGNRLTSDQYNWIEGAVGSADAGKIIITLAFNPASSSTLGVVFHDYTYPDRIFDKAGKYFYAITYYDQSTGWESPPVYTDIEITESFLNDGTGTAFIKFTSLKAKQSVLDLFPYVKIRLYRIPFGGSEYLLSMTLDGDNTNTFYDSTSDTNLGIMLTTEGNTEIPLSSADVISIAMHKESLFVALNQDRILYYSKPTKYNQFPAENFFYFENPIVGILTHNERLVVLTEHDIYIIYGTGLGYTATKIDYHVPLNCTNSARSLSGALFSVWSNGAEYGNQRRGIFTMVGHRVADIALKIRNTLDSVDTDFILGSQPVSETKANRNTIIDNRYYVVELIKSTTKVDDVYIQKKISIVYDTYMNGFSIYDSDLSLDGRNCFIYRTKEFVREKRDNPRLTQYNKGIWIRGIGDFKVEFIGDNEVITTKAFSSDKVDILTTNVKPTRYNSFSIRFTGSANCKIYDWGLLW